MGKYGVARRGLGTLRGNCDGVHLAPTRESRFPSRHRVNGDMISATWHPSCRLSGPNDKDKLPGPPARPSCRAKPGWRPLSASSVVYLPTSPLLDFIVSIMSAIVRS